VLYSPGSGVNRVAMDLSGLSIRLFVSVQLKMVCKYGWKSCSAIL